MSRIGKKRISIPSGVMVNIMEDVVQVSGSLGKLTVPQFKGITVSVEENEVVVQRSNDEKQTKAFHGLQRSLLFNAIVGVSEGFKKTLKLVGTGYRVKALGKGIELSVGFSHPVVVTAPESINIVVEGNDTVVVSGSDKQLVGEVSANIRKVRPPEPYKGKGIKYSDEVVRRKQGKAAS